MKKILILEDNRKTLDYIMAIIEEMHQQCVLLPCQDLQKAYQITLEKRVDLFIIDIILDTGKPGDASGLQFVDNIRKIERYTFTPVIFVTSLEDAKLYTYEKLHCFSFIEKPFDPLKLQKLVKKCLAFPRLEEKEKTLYFRKDGIILAVEREEIGFVECRNHNLIIYTANGDQLTIPYITIKKFITDVESSDFIRCSRSSVVNRKFVKNIDITNRIIQMKNDIGNVEIGVMYKKEMKEKFC